MAEKNPKKSSIDRLSSLHDSILAQILSFLPTKESIKTSILSKRFRHAYSSVQSLNFALIYPNDADLVSRALARISPSKITSFCCVVVSTSTPRPLEWTDGRVLLWVDYAVARHVQRLTLRLRTCLQIKKIIQCRSLQFLDLQGELYLHPFSLLDPPAPILRNLTTLRLRFTQQYPGDWVGKLVSGCCQLEDLLLAGMVFDFVDIAAPKLRRLVLGLVRVSIVQIRCPSLECFEFAVNKEIRNFRGDHMPSLRRVMIQVPAVSCQSDGRWSEILGSVRDAEQLHLLSCLNFKLSPRNLLNESDKHLSTFCNLRRMQLIACFHHDNIEFMIYLLEQTPKLNELSISIESACRCIDKEKTWILRKLPSKILYTLKVIKILNSNSCVIRNKDEFVEFLSTNVSVWRKVRKMI